MAIGVFVCIVVLLLLGVGCRQYLPQERCATDDPAATPRGTFFYPRRSMKASDVTLEWLEEHGLEGKEGDNGTYLYWCPVHDDMGSPRKGLSVSCPHWPKTKPVLCKCHSPQCGATLPRVIAALSGDQSSNGHVTVTKVSPILKNGGMAWWVEKTQIPEETWNNLGCYEHGGGIEFQFTGEQVRKIRRNEKEFMWVPSKGITPSLWPMPDDELPEHIWITEGESDCGTARYTGHYAFAATKGAQTPLSVVEFQALASRGVQEITICTDRNDDIFGAHLAKAATDAFLTVNILDLNRVVDPFWSTKDLNDLWRETETEEEFAEAVERATYRIEEQTPFTTHAEAFEIAEEEREWYVNELIAPGDKVMIAGPPKAFKTWVGLDLTRCLLTGAPFLNRPEWSTPRPMRVLLVEEEGSRHAFAQRLTRMKRDDNLFFMHKAGISFTDPGMISSLIHSCKQHKIDVVIFDPLQRMIPGINENDAAETAVIWNEVFRMQLAIPHLAVVILHHANKGEKLTQESVRGSSRHIGEVDLYILVEKFDKTSIRIHMDGRDIFTDLGPGEALQGVVKIEDDDFSINTQEFAVRVKQTKVDNNRADVLKAVREGFDTRTKIMRAVGLSDTSVRDYLDALVEEELVVMESQGEGKPNIYTCVEES